MSTFKSSNVLVAPVCSVDSGSRLDIVPETAPVTGIALLNVISFTCEVRTLICYHGIVSYQVPGEDRYLLLLWQQLK